MIKLKQILLEGKPSIIFIPRRIEDRFERRISLYIKNGSKGSFDLQYSNLTKFPEILKNVDVGGYFDCSHTNLTSLENSPKSVSGDFYCINNKLTSLVGAPKIVGGDFWCSYNDLTSLEGAPKVVGKDFFCNGNPGNFTSEQVRAICDVKGRIIV